MDETSTQSPIEKSNSQTPLAPLAMGAVAVAIIIIAGLVWWFVSQKTTNESASESTGIGSELFEGVSNPIEGKVPTVKATANPIENIYKNPFE